MEKNQRLQPEPPYLTNEMLNAEVLANGPEETLSMHPRRFALWLFIVSIIMIFASMTSAYLVRQAEGNWLEFEIPPILWISTGVILASSLTVQLAFFAAQRDNLPLLRTLMLFTLGFGFAFLYLQWESWVRLVHINVYLVGNPSGSFMYVITGLHAFHLISGLVYLTIVTVNTFRYKVHSRNILDLELAATYWHFLDFLWVALFAFLLWSHSG
jgi:cytochrome c oxidase subunit III